MQIEEKEPIRVLITGAHSYIGTSFEKWVSENCPRIQTDTLDLKKTDWEKTDFSGYAAVFHVAGDCPCGCVKGNRRTKTVILSGQYGADCPVCGKGKGGRGKTVYFYEQYDCLRGKRFHEAAPDDYPGDTACAGKFLWGQQGQGRGKAAEAG